MTTKRESCIKLLTKNPKLTNEEVVAIIGCCDKTVERARQDMRKAAVDAFNNEETRNRTSEDRKNRSDMNDLSNESLEKAILRLIQKYGETPDFIRLAVDFKNKMKIDEEANKKIDWDEIFKDESNLYS